MTVWVQNVEADDVRDAMDVFSSMFASDESPEFILTKILNNDRHRVAKRQAIEQHKSSPVPSDHVTIDLTDPNYLRILSMTHHQVRPIVDLLAACNKIPQNTSVAMQRAIVILHLMSLYASLADSKAGYAREAQAWIDGMVGDIRGRYNQSGEPWLEHVLRNAPMFVTV